MGLFDKLKGAFGNTSTQTEEKEKKKNTAWFFGDEAKKRFENFEGTWELYLDCFKENVNEETFAYNFTTLAKGDTYDLAVKRRAYDERLQGDNILKFVNEYIEALCEENEVGNKLVSSYSFWGNTYYYLLTFVCGDLLTWEPDEDDDPDTLPLSYPEGLKFPNNQILHVLITFYKYGTLNYSTETNNAIVELLETIAHNHQKRFDLLEPQIFEPSFFADPQYKDEFVDRMMSVVNKYK